jgi:hypothetical protein
MYKLSMTILRIFFAAFLFISSGCSKSADEPRVTASANTMFGIWTGTYQTNQIVHPAQAVTFTIYPDGNIVGKVKGNPPAQDVIYEAGTWTATGNVISYKITTLNYTSVIKQEGSFTFSDGTLINGTWKNTTSDNGVFYTGTFSTLTKVN